MSKNAKKSPVVTSTLVNAVATSAVVDLINAANESAVTSDAHAREAAIKANETDFLTVGKAAERLDKILGLYASVLTHQAVKQSFSAALAILVADKPVRIQASEVGHKANGTVTFKSPEALSPVADKGEKIPEKKMVETLTPEQAISQLTVGVMKQAATMARESLGVARAKGAGPAKKANTNARAPFMMELAAAIKDDALRSQMVSMWRLAGYDVITLAKGSAPSTNKPEPSLAEQMS